ncbi:MAG: M56 family metallopeptidase [Lachnospiraceae bacterium]|nr:M56 family metallopeptidase [Lachnospiraceae bacterium]
MDWLSNLFVVLLLTDIAGTIFFFISVVLKRTPFGRDIGFQRFLMNVTLCAFLVPFVYFALYVDKRINTVELESDINLFYSTPLIRRFNAVLGCIWVGLFFALLLYRLYRRYRWAMICRGNIPEEDEAIGRVFENVSAALGVSGKVSLYRNDSIEVPCITYHHGYVVMLPLIRYKEKEAEVIFYHELCHFLNHDMYIKTIGCIVALLHVFNPAAHILLSRMDLLCEKYCDRAACKKGKDTFTREEYLQTILNLLLTDGREERYQLFALVDSISNYERRVKFMLDNHKHGTVKKGAALLMAACFLLGSSTSALAAGNGVTAVYEGLAESTSVRTENGVDINTMSDAEDAIMLELMKECNLDPEDVVITDDEVTVGAQRSSRNITWTIPVGKTYMTSGFPVAVGDKMSALVVGTPEDIEFEAGIKDPDCIMHYTTSHGMLAFNYDVKMKGRHYFYICNLSETEELHIEATVIVTEKEELEGTTE